MRLTAEMLLVKGACENQVQVFVGEWPDGVEITEAVVLRAYELGLDIDWFVETFLTALALAEYHKAAAAAWAEYEKVTAPAWAEYEKVTAPAWAEYEKVRDATRAEYDKVRAPAVAEYEKVRDAAWAEYDKAAAAAWAEYQKVTAPALIAALELEGKDATFDRLTPDTGDNKQDVADNDSSR